MPGPFVQMATLCEKTLQEADGVLSIIRAVDRVVVTAEGPDLPTDLPRGRLPLILVVMLKSDEARGRYPITLRTQQPSGLYLEDRTFDAIFEGEERGFNLILQIDVDAVEGLYWFDVVLNDQLLTRVPLRIMYRRVQAGP